MMQIKFSILNIKYFISTNENKFLQNLFVFIFITVERP